MENLGTIYMEGIHGLKVSYLIKNLNQLKNAILTFNPRFYHLLYVLEREISWRGRNTIYPSEFKKIT